MAEEKKGFFSRLVAGLAKTRNAVVNGLDDIFNGPGDVDDEFYEELEETLITGDIGVRATDEILEELKAKVKEQHIKQRGECRRVLIETIKEQMDLGENAYDFEHRKSVLLLVGVNGVGKTTTAGKMAAQYKNEGKKVLLAASLLTPAHLYIWDEPLNYIDVFSRIQIEELLKSVHPTMLIVEHDVRFMEQFAGKVIDLRKEDR